MVLNVLASIGQYEREIMLERQREGIRLAQEKGHYKGRAFVKLPENFVVAHEKYKKSTRENPFAFEDFMKETELKRSTLIKILKELETNTMSPNRTEQVTKKKRWK